MSVCGLRGRWILEMMERLYVYFKRNGNNERNYVNTGAKSKFWIALLALDEERIRTSRGHNTISKFQASGIFHSISLLCVNVLTNIFLPMKFVELFFVQKQFCVKTYLFSTFFLFHNLYSSYYIIK